MSGKIYLAGAGPGDPSLITLKLHHIMQQVDVVLYDYLVGDPLLSRIPDHIEKIYVGKKGDGSSDPNVMQEFIHNQLLLYYKQGKQVLRLKGGDPFVFGRGFEELQYCTKQGLAYEIIPGLSSPITGLAYAGVPLTHRGTANSFAVLTGHYQDEQAINHLVIPKVDTLVFVMAMKNLAAITQKCIDQGYESSCPCIFIERATTAQQRSTKATLGTAVKIQKEQGIKAPALWAIGKSVDLGLQPSWFEQLPLFGKRLMVTRPYDQASELINGLEHLGAEVISYATIEIKSLPMYPEAEQLQRCNRIYFTSKHAVDYFFRALEQMGLDARSCANKKIIAIGPGTSKALKRHGLLPDQVPSKASVQGLIDSFPSHLENHICLLPQAKHAMPDLAKAIETSHGQVIVWPLYETIARPWPPLYNATLDGMIVTSPSSIPQYEKQFKQRQTKLFCMGQSSAKAAAQMGWPIVFIAKQPNSIEIINTVKQELAN